MPKKIAIVTSRDSWFIPYAKKLVRMLKRRGHRVKLFSEYEKVPLENEIIFILSYYKIINQSLLKQKSLNLVVHESDLPKGKGWAPLFWQILDNRNNIPIVMFTPTEKVDSGDIYMKDEIILDGYELHNEIREKQAMKTIEICLRFIAAHNKNIPKKQVGRSTYYRKRTPLDSELDIEKSIKEQFNLLRIVDNDFFPAFFNYGGRRYILKVYKQSLEDK